MTTAISKPTLATLIATENALVASAIAAGVKGQEREAMHVLRHAAGFLDHAAEMVAEEASITGPEVVRQFQWAVMKLVEFNEMLPDGVRGKLSAECFQRG